MPLINKLTAIEEGKLIERLAFILSRRCPFIVEHHGNECIVRSHHDLYSFAPTAAVSSLDTYYRFQTESEAKSKVLYLTAQYFLDELLKAAEE